MTLPEQAAMLLEAAGQQWLRVKDIQGWADRILCGPDHPPPWIMELATSKAEIVADLIPILREQAAGPLPLRRRIQVVVMATEVGLLTLPAAVGRLFEMMFLEVEDRLGEASDEALRDALVECECRDDYTLADPELRHRFETLFQEYAKDAGDIGVVLLGRRTSGNRSEE